MAAVASLGIILDSDQIPEGISRKFVRYPGEHQVTTIWCFDIAIYEANNKINDVDDKCHDSNDEWIWLKSLGRIGFELKWFEIFIYIDALSWLNYNYDDDHCRTSSTLASPISITRVRRFARSETCHASEWVVWLLDNPWGWCWHGEQWKWGYKDGYNIYCEIILRVENTEFAMLGNKMTVIWI